MNLAGHRSEKKASAKQEAEARARARVGAHLLEQQRVDVLEVVGLADGSAHRDVVDRREGVGEGGDSNRQVDESKDLYAGIERVASAGVAAWQANHMGATARFDARIAHLVEVAGRRDVAVANRRHCDGRPVDGVDGSHAQRDESVERSDQEEEERAEHRARVAMAVVDAGVDLLEGETFARETRTEVYCQGGHAGD